MRISKRQLRRIIKEEKAKVLAEQRVRRIVRKRLMESAPVVFEFEGRGNPNINGMPIPASALERYYAAAEAGDVQSMAMHLKKMGVTHVKGDIDTADALGLGLDDIISVDEWLSFRNSVR